MTTLKTKKTRISILLLCFFAGMLSAKAFGVNPQLFIGKAAMPAESTNYLWSFFAFFLTWFYYFVFVSCEFKPRLGEILWGIFFGILNFFGTTLFAYDSWAFIGVHQSWFVVIYKCLAQGMVMVTALTYITNVLQTKSKEVIPCLMLDKIPSNILEFYRKHPTFSYFCVFVVCWSPYLIIYYPGTVISDMAWMFEQLQGITPMTTWHSVFTTWVFGGCIYIGRIITGADNLGCLLYVLLQTGMLAGAIASIMALLRTFQLDWRWRVGALAFFAITPIFGAYCSTIGKDTLHTATLALFLVLTIQWYKQLRPFTVWRWMGYGLLALVGCLWRNNGIYIILASLVLFAVVLAKGKQRIWVSTICVVVTIITSILNQWIIPNLGIENNSSSGIYSVCFQQTARTVRDNYDTLTETEKSEIDHVLELDEIGNLYQPWISDPVKYTYKQFGKGLEIEKEALKRYFHTWFSMFKKYPITYIEAFIAGNKGYYSFNPPYVGYTYSQQAGKRFFFVNYGIEGEGQLASVQPESLAKLRNTVATTVERFRTIPIIQLLFTCPFYTWLLVGVSIVFARRNRGKDLALLCPAVLSFAVCLVSPVDDYFRYFLPIIVMTIPLLAISKQKIYD